MKSKLLVGLSILVLAVFGTVRAGAQESLSEGVGRVSLIHGDVSTQRGDSGDFAAAALNQPVVSGDKVSTGGASRAEVQLDYANVLRLSDNSQATIAGLTRSQIQVQIGQGLADFSVFKGTEAEVEIDTPNVAVHPLRKDGVFRIEVNGDVTRVIVRKGEADISTPQGSTHVEKGQLITVRGAEGDTQYQVADAPSKDSWDSWVNDRNGTIRHAESWQHTNQYYTGAEDLDAYGHWQSVPDYGYVWAPVVPVGWAPYRDGRWVWEPNWGWTWVSYEPWGWAPYHYGRWFPYGGSWVWWPGPVYSYYRPVWAPAYVSFFGFGSGGFFFGFGSVGWLPIGPCDYFYPWYGGYRSHYNVVNITNINNITIINNNRGRRWGGFSPLHPGNRFSNLRLAATDTRIREAISTVPAEHFGKGSTKPAPYSHVGFRDGGMMTGGLPIVPTKQSLSASDRPAAPSTLRGGGQERFFSKSRPAATVQPFDKQVAQLQQDIQRNGGAATNRPGARSETPGAKPGAAMNNPAMNTPRTPGQEAKTPMQPKTGRGLATPDQGVEKPGAGLKSAPPNDGWRRFGSDLAENRPPENPQQSTTKAKPSSPAQPRNAPPKDAKPAGPDQSGWRRFSDSKATQSGDRPAASGQQPENRGGSQPAPGNVPPSRSTSPARTTSPSRDAQPDRNDGWRRFTPQPGAGTPESPNRGNPGNDQWNRFPSRGDAPAAQNNSRETRPRGYGDTRGSRPPLDLRQPIVTPRPSPGAGPSQRGGASRPEPRSGGGNRGGSGGSAPSRPPSPDKHR